MDQIFTCSKCGWKTNMIGGPPHKCADTPAQDAAKERWADIPGCTGYQVSNLGRIRNLQTRGGRLLVPPRILKPLFTRKGYCRVSLPFKDGRKSAQIHRLVAYAFCDGYGPNLHASHLDGNPANNEASNLKWCTPSENIRHKTVHGTMAIGERNGQSKLTKDQVLTILNLRKAGKPLRKLAKQYGVNYSSICKIVRGEMWSHIYAQWRANGR